MLMYLCICLSPFLSGRDAQRGSSRISLHFTFCQSRATFRYPHPSRGRFLHDVALGTRVAVGSDQGGPLRSADAAYLLLWQACVALRPGTPGSSIPGHGNLGGTQRKSPGRRCRRADRAESRFPSQKPMAKNWTRAPLQINLEKRRCNVFPSHIGGPGSRLGLQLFTSRSRSCHRLSARREFLAIRDLMARIHRISVAIYTCRSISS